MARHCLLAAVASVLVVHLAAAEPLTTIERQRLLAHMDMTAAWLADELRGLSPAQLAFRPDEKAWSVLEVLEHLVVVGPIYWRDLHDALKTKPRSRPSTNTDEDILWYGIDRTHRETAIPGERAPGKLRDLETGLAAYRRQHAQLRDYIRTTKDDLRAHVVDRQGSDAYQWALLISTHEQRHILQIRELKAHARFPKN